MLAVLTRFYQRHPARYIPAEIVFITIQTELAVVVTMTIVGRHFAGLTWHQTFLAMGLIQPAPLLCVGVGLFALRPDIAIISQWMSGHDPRPAPQQVADSTDRTIRVGFRVVVICAILAAPLVPAIVVISGGHATGTRIVALAIGGLFGVSYAGLSVFLTEEIAIRPLLADLAAAAPELNRPTARPVTVATRLAVGLFGACGISGILVGALLTKPGTGAERILLSAAVASGVLLAILFPLVTSVLDPIAALKRGTTAVGAGDLDVVIPITSRDDIGQLVGSFNDMVVGLREREGLRGHNRELNAALQESRARIVASGDAERRRLERDIHDGAQQYLVTINLKLGMLSRRLADDPEAAAALIAELREDAQSALSELRDLAHGIYPALLENEGLAGALGQATRKAGISAELRAGSAERYPSQIEAAVYFCCLEALQNASKHAGTDAHATVTLTPEEERLVFAVADTGPGFDAANTSSHGLHNMSDRIGAVGGELTIESVVGAGTTVRGWVPSHLAVESSVQAPTAVR